MDNNNKDLIKRIMRRVYAIWFVKRVTPVLFLEMPIFIVIALRETAREFFVARILENFLLSFHSGGILSGINFIKEAFFATNGLPLAVIGFSFGFFLVLAFRVFRNFRQLTLVRI